MLNSKNRVFNPYFSISTCPMIKNAFVNESRVEHTIFSMEKISFSLKLFSGHFYGQSFIKTVRGPCKFLKCTFVCTGSCRAYMKKNKKISRHTSRGKSDKNGIFTLGRHILYLINIFFRKILSNVLLLNLICYFRV